MSLKEVQEATAKMLAHNAECRRLRAESVKNGTPLVLPQRPIVIPTRAADDKPFAAKAKQYLGAELSQARRGKVSLEVFDMRKAKCLACKFRTDTVDLPLGSVRDEGGIGFCSRCKCDGAKRSALSLRLWMPKPGCPEGFFGEAEGVGMNLADAADAAKGIAGSIVEQVKKII